MKTIKKQYYVKNQKGGVIVRHYNGVCSEYAWSYQAYGLVWNKKETAEKYAKLMSCDKYQAEVVEF